MLTNFFTRAFAQNTLIHGALMAALAAITVVLQPILQQISNGGAIPAWPVISAALIHAVVVGIVAFILYMIKNGLFGSANIPKAATIIVIGMFMFFAPSVSSAQANSLIQMTGIRGTGGDTVTNTGVVYDTLLMSNAYAAGSVVTTIKKISGTVSPTVILQGSADGLHWITFGQDTDFVSNSTGTVSYTWPLPGLPMKSRTTGSTLYQVAPPVLPFLYYKVQATGTGTMSAIVKSWFAVR